MEANARTLRGNGSGEKSGSNISAYCCVQRNPLGHVPREVLATAVAVLLTWASESKEAFEIDRGVPPLPRVMRRGAYQRLKVSVLFPSRYA